MMTRPQRLAVCALAAVILTGCGTIAAWPQAQGRAPDTRAIVLRYLRGDKVPSPDVTVGPGPGSLFTNPQKLGSVELSQPDLVQHPTLGWTWLACLRTHPIERGTSDYALFMGPDRIRDARLSVATDRCAARAYQVLGIFGAAVHKPEAPRSRRSRANR